MILGRIHSVVRLANTPNILSTTHSFRTFLTQTQSPLRLPSIPQSVSPILTQLRTYKLKSCSSYKLRFRKSKSLKSDFMKRGYTLHGHKRTGETHQQRITRAGDRPVAKGYAKLIMRKLAPRR